MELNIPEEILLPTVRSIPLVTLQGCIMSLTITKEIRELVLSNEYYAAPALLAWIENDLSAPPTLVELYVLWKDDRLRPILKTLATHNSQQGRFLARLSRRATSSLN